MSPLATLRNSCCGDLFIFASGSSAAEFPLEHYKNMRFMTVNGSIQRFMEAGMRPFAHVFSDRNFVLQSRSLVLDSLDWAERVFLKREHYEEILQLDLDGQAAPDNLYYIHRANRLHEFDNASSLLFAIRNLLDNELLYDFSLLSKTRNRIGFSKNLAKGYFCGRTIPYIALQVAYYLGFNRVFLVGVDLSASVGRFYDQGSAQALPTSLDKDFDKFILPSFRFMAKNILNERFRVYNLSASSRLPDELIPRLDYHELELMLNG